MKKPGCCLVLLCWALLSDGQSKFFFDNIDMTLNMHVGDATIRQQSWPQLFKKEPSTYSVDTFYRGENYMKCVIFPFIPTSVSAGLRFSKNLFPKSDRHLVKERIEWRTGIFVGAKTQSSAWFTDQDFTSQPPSGIYTYKQLSLYYRRRWIDFNNHVVYKIPSLLARNTIKYYIGAGIGITIEADSHITEKLVQYRATPISNGYTITEESNITREEKGKTVTSPYIGFTSGMEIKCNEAFYVLLETNYQGYTHSFSIKNKLYKEGVYLSLILRYKF